MVTVQFYTKENCSLCDEAYTLLMLFQSHYDFELEEIDIYSDDALLEEYQLLIPAVRMNDTFLTCEEMGYENLDAALKRNTLK